MDSVRANRHARINEVLDTGMVPLYDIGSKRIAHVANNDKAIRATNFIFHGPLTKKEY
jgi:hypothetical protein